MKIQMKLLSVFLFMLCVLPKGNAQTLEDFKDIYGKDKKYVINKFGKPSYKDKDFLGFNGYTIFFDDQAKAYRMALRSYYKGEFPCGITRQTKKEDIFKLFKYVKDANGSVLDDYCCSNLTVVPGRMDPLSMQFYFDKKDGSLNIVRFHLALLFQDGRVNDNVTQPTLSAGSGIASTTNQKPPILSIKNVAFSDPGGNNIIDGDEACKVCFTIVNTGKGAARELNARLENLTSVQGLKLADYTIGSIEPGTAKDVCIPVSGSRSLTSGTAKIKISFTEKMGMSPDPVELSIVTRAFNKPDIIVADNAFYADNGSLKLGMPIRLKALIQNIGQGDVQNVNVNFSYPEKNVFPNGESSFNLGNMASGAKKEVVFEFIANKLYTPSTIPVSVSITDKTGLLNYTNTFTAGVDSKSSATSILVESKVTETPKANIEIGSLRADVDKSIPVTNQQRENAYALIIGNEDYSSFQPGLAKEVNVDYALNDAQIFKEYCIQTLGIPQRQIKTLANATSGQMNEGLAWINNLADVANGKAELVFYYSGHGLPDDNKESYLIPVDVSGKNVKQGIKLNDVYRQLTEHSPQKVTVFLDACFSGGARNQNLVAMKGIKIKPKEDMLSGNLVVFASSSGEESSGVFRDMQHGYMTYFLLKKIQETKGDVTLKDLADYIRIHVKKETGLADQIQTPQVNVSPAIENSWANWKLR